MKISAQNYIRNQRLQQELELKVLTPEELRSLQMALLEIYSEIKRICDKYSLPVLLGGGSALGAVRHKGFIPWDDDMDLMMLRKDYDRFVEVFSLENHPSIRLKENGMSLHIVKEGTTYVGLLDSNPEESGIYIDIFPIDYAPENKCSRFFRGICSDILLFLLNSKGVYLSRSPYLKSLFSQNIQARIIFYIRNILGFMVSRVSQRTFLNIHRRIVVSKASQLLTIPSGRKHYFGELLDYSVFFPSQKGEFEHLQVQLPHWVDVYLSNLYGTGYMNLPPADKRETHPCLSFHV